MEDHRTHKYKHIREQNKEEIRLKNSLKSWTKQQSLRKPPPIKLIARPTIWDDIVWEDKEFENYIRKQNLKNFPKFKCDSGYLQKRVFPELIPAFEKLCILTFIKCAQAQHKEIRFFDFLDGLAEYLYNNNTRFKERKTNWKSIHMVYKNKQRDFFPYFWFLTDDEAATKIQALVRGFLVRAKMRKNHEGTRRSLLRSNPLRLLNHIF